MDIDLKQSASVEQIQLQNRERDIGCRPPVIGSRISLPAVRSHGMDNSHPCASAGSQSDQLLKSADIEHSGDATQTSRIVVFTEEQCTDKFRVRQT